MNTFEREGERQIDRSRTPVAAGSPGAAGLCDPRTLSRVLEVVIAVAALVVGLVAGWAIGRVARSATPTQPAVSAVPTPEPIGAQAAEILDALRSISLVVDASDRVVRSSPSASALGLVRGPEMVHDELRTLVRTARRDQDLHEVELELTRGFNGAGRLVLGVRVTPLSGGHVLALIDDRSQLRRVEETRRDFVVNVSHELKTPVAGLSLLAEAVVDASDDPDAVRRFAGRMGTETARLNQLVQEIVELSRLQVAETLDAPERVDVRACALDAVEHLRLVADDRNISITTDDDGSPAEVFGDANLVTTAIRNLVENAVNYSADDTRVTVTVKGSADLVTVAVKDQGSGIPAAELDRVFERFYRVDAARSRRTGGTGLGLAIVKHVCANHGGEVTVWSEEGHGSTFTIRLPAAQPQNPTPGEPAEPVRKVTT